MSITENKVKRELKSFYIIVVLWDHYLKATLFQSCLIDKRDPLDVRANCRKYTELLDKNGIVFFVEYFGELHQVIFSW